MGALTARELELLDRAANGDSSKQIARFLGLSEQHVKNTMSSIMTKLRASSRTHAVAIAITAGLISLHPWR